MAKDKKPQQKKAGKQHASQPKTAATSCCGTMAPAQTKTTCCG